MCNYSNRQITVKTYRGEKAGGVTPWVREDMEHIEFALYCQGPWEHNLKAIKFRTEGDVRESLSSRRSNVSGRALGFSMGCSRPDGSQGLLRCLVGRHEGLRHRVAQTQWFSTQSVCDSGRLLFTSPTDVASFFPLLSKS